MAHGSPSRKFLLYCSNNHLTLKWYLRILCSLQVYCNSTNTWRKSKYTFRKLYYTNFIKAFYKTETLDIRYFVCNDLIILRHSNGNLMVILWYSQWHSFSLDRTIIVRGNAKSWRPRYNYVCAYIADSPHVIVVKSDWLANRWQRRREYIGVN